MFTHKSNILKATLYALILAVIVQSEILVIPTVYAAGDVGAGVQGALGADLVSLTGYMAYINTFMHIMLFIILQFLGYLLQADFFNNPIMMGSLNSIWVLSRDIMNIIFALMLIGVSFYVIITGKTDKAKEKIVNFVVAVILVNFSWFFPRVIMDIANILTATVYTIPNILGQGFTCKTLDENGPVDCRVVTNAIIFPSPEKMTEFCPVRVIEGPGIWCTCVDGIECHKTDTYANAQNTMAPAHAMINGLAVSFARITVLATIPTSTIGRGGAPPLNDTQAAMVSLEIAMSVMLAFAIQLAVILPLLGLAVGLFIRIVILWVTTAFMPFSFLGYVINGKLGTNIFEFETDIWKEFLNAAFLPVTIAIPFVIGFIMLSAVATVPAPPGLSESLTIGVPILSGVKTWWQLLWTMAAVGIIWTGAFAALSKSKIIGKFTDKIKGVGESVFGSIAKIPLLVPLPLPFARNVGGLANLPRNLSGAMTTITSGRSDLTPGQAFRQSVGIGGNGGENDPVRLAETLRNDRDNAQKIVDAVRAVEGAVGADRQGKMDELKTAFGHSEMSNIEALTLLNQTMEHSKPGSLLADPALKAIVDNNIAIERPATPPATPAP